MLLRVTGTKELCLIDLIWEGKKTAYLCKLDDNIDV